MAAPHKVAGNHGEAGGDGVDPQRVTMQSDRPAEPTLLPAGEWRVDSLATGNDDRDAHLLGKGFFAADEFPEITFESRRISAIGDRRWRIVGDLVIRDRRCELERALQLDPAAAARAAA
jgi:hypothetical protein